MNDDDASHGNEALVTGAYISRNRGGNTKSDDKC